MTKSNPYLFAAFTHADTAVYICFRLYVIFTFGYVRSSDGLLSIENVTTTEPLVTKQLLHNTALPDVISEMPLKFVQYLNISERFLFCPPNCRQL